MRKNYGNKLVKQVIVMATATMLTVSPVMTVMAEETTESSEKDSLHEKCNDEHVDSDKDEKHDDQEEKAEKSEETDKEEKEAASKQSDIVEEKSDVIKEDNQKAVKTEEKEAESVNAGEYADIASQVKEKAIGTDVTQDLDDIENTIESIDEALIVTEINEDGEESNSGLQEYVSEQTDEVKKQEENAKIALEEALKIETDTVNDEVSQKVEEVIKAADAAQDACKKAEDAYKKADEAVIEAIKKYNAYVDAYGITDEEGKPLYQYYYDELKVYTPEELAASGIVIPDKTSEQKEEQLSSLETENLTEQAQILQDAVKTYQQANQEFQDAQKTAEEANEAVIEAKDNAQEILKNQAKIIEEPTEEIGNSDYESFSDTDMEEHINEVNEQLQQAKENYDEADKNLKKLQEEAKKTLESKTLSSTAIKEKLQELQKKIEKAEEERKAAKEELNVAQASAAAAQNYKNWAESLVQEQKATAFAQKDKEHTDNIYAGGNDLGYDIDNPNVISRPTSDFIRVSEKKGVTVPYTVYREYVQRMYEDKEAYKNLPSGKGISIDKDNGVLFWKVQKNGDQYELTGEVVTEESKLETGTYFVGYSFKYENGDKFYHIDGYIYNYTKTEPEENPEDKRQEDNTNPSGDNDNKRDSGSKSNSKKNTSNTTATPVIIEDDMTPLASTIPSTTTINDDTTPLAATIIDDENVALTDSVPQTGDTSVPIMPLAAAGTVSVGMAYLVSAMKKRK